MTGSQEEHDPYAPPPHDEPARGPGPGPGTPPHPPQLRQRAGPVLGDGRRALVLAALGVLLLVPVLPAGAVLSLAGLVLGIRALRAAGAARGTAPGAVPAVVLGALGSAAAVVLLLAAAVLWPQIRDYRDCISGANTEIAKDVCRVDLERATPGRVPILR